eukprot:TRINITY_DN43336_c0_g1_i1.p1 TRINITY_DN43336_c0_g1~~TRINITY_DN43336_c0_g1_i1.p1  ORF type:complete len:571 (+),score=232.06 TRINITY_DN43336_c0_g1_i1:55-1713(+)
MPGRAARGAAGGKSRVRTESMIDRLGKKPMSEGFELWDKDYVLGSLRLFQCKLEVAPPFEVAGCYDAVAEILTILEDTDEAVTNFEEASKKYSMINKSRMSALMACMATGLTSGPDAALASLERSLESFDKKFAAGSSADEVAEGDDKAALAREYLYRAQTLNAVGKHKEAAEAADHAFKLGGLRPHLALLEKATALHAADSVDGAIQACKDAVSMRPCYFAAFEKLGTLQVEREESCDEGVAALQSAFAIHPKASLTCAAAFAVSDQGKNDQAIKMLSDVLEKPPQEEGEDVEQSRATLLKARAAVYADIEKFAEAIKDAQGALKECPGDEEIRSMLEQLQEISGIKPEPEEDDAAKKIQALQRGRQARREAEEKKAKKQAELDAQAKRDLEQEAKDQASGDHDEDEAAKKIQALQRGRKARQEADEKKKKAQGQVVKKDDEKKAPPDPSAAQGSVDTLRVGGVEPGSPSVHDVSGVAHTEGDLARIFNQIDVNGNGWLSAEELTNFYIGMDHFGLEPDPHFIERQLKQFGGDGRVTFNEFAVIMLRIAAR